MKLKYIIDGIFSNMQYICSHRLYSFCMICNVRITMYMLFLSICWPQQASLIVENVHLHVLPSMNPDGFSLRQRGNANNIDLNRDFPDQVSHNVIDFSFIYLYFCSNYIIMNYKDCNWAW